MVINHLLNGVILQVEKPLATNYRETRQLMQPKHFSGRFYELEKHGPGVFCKTLHLLINDIKMTSPAKHMSYKVESFSWQFFVAPFWDG